jgi:hypothetical protein
MFTPIEVKLERHRASFGHSVILLARAAAHPYRTNNLSITFQRDAPGKDHDAAVIET